MSGGKGGSQTSQVEIPQYLEDASKKMLNRASAVQGVGYMPYMGPDVAALTQPQQQAMQSNIDAASAFGLVDPGLNAMAGMPEAQDFNGVQGYSSFPMYEQAVADLAASRPGQVAAYDKLFVDPVTGLGGPGNLFNGYVGGGGGPGSSGNNGGAPTHYSDIPIPDFDPGIPDYAESPVYTNPGPVGQPYPPVDSPFIIPEPPMLDTMVPDMVMPTNPTIISNPPMHDTMIPDMVMQESIAPNMVMHDTMIPDMVMQESIAPNMVMPNNPFKNELLYSDPNMGNNINTGTFKMGKTPASGLLDLKNFNKRIY